MLYKRPPSEKLRELARVQDEYDEAAQFMEHADNPLNMEALAEDLRVEFRHSAARVPSVIELLVAESIRKSLAGYMREAVEQLRTREQAARLAVGLPTDSGVDRIRGTTLAAADISAMPPSGG